jgi:hypothetical protein
MGGSRVSILQAQLDHKMDRIDDINQAIQRNNRINEILIDAAGRWNFTDRQAQIIEDAQYLIDQSSLLSSIAFQLAEEVRAMLEGA